MMVINNVSDQSVTIFSFTTKTPGISRISRGGLPGLVNIQKATEHGH